MEKWLFWSSRSSNWSVNRWAKEGSCATLCCINVHAIAWKKWSSGRAFKLISSRHRCWEPKGIRSSSYMPDIRVVGIMAKPGIPHASAIVTELVGWLHTRGVEARLDPETACYLGHGE